MTTVIFAPHFEEESKASGATPDNIRAGRRLVELAAEKSDLVNVTEIQITKLNPLFRVWSRIKSERMTVRAIAELFVDPITSDEVILVHAILPRHTDTYDKDVKALWKKYRTRITPQE